VGARTLVAGRDGCQWRPCIIESRTPSHCSSTARGSEMGSPEQGRSRQGACAQTAPDLGRSDAKSEAVRMCIGISGAALRSGGAADGVATAGAVARSSSSDGSGSFHFHDSLGNRVHGPNRENLGGWAVANVAHCGGVRRRARHAIRVSIGLFCKAHLKWVI